MVTLDFTDCKTVEDVNKKWVKYAKDIEPYKSFFKKIISETSAKKPTSKKEGT